MKKPFTYFYNESGNYTVAFQQDSELEKIVTIESSETRAKRTTQVLNEIIKSFILPAKCEQAPVKSSAVKKQKGSQFDVRIYLGKKSFKGKM